jgi:hypothetical protein
VVVALAGCRTGTQITAFPRVDLDLSGGNRGYLVGTPPPEPQLKTTRQMVETTIELPSFYKPKRTHRPVSLDGGPQPTTELPPASAASDTWQQVPAPGEYTK